jgi:hypothetical protein
MKTRLKFELSLSEKKRQDRILAPMGRDAWQGKEIVISIWTPTRTQSSNPQNPSSSTMQRERDIKLSSTQYPERQVEYKNFQTGAQLEMKYWHNLRYNMINSGKCCNTDKLTLDFDWLDFDYLTDEPIAPTATIKFYLRIKLVDPSDPDAPIINYHTTAQNLGARHDSVEVNAGKSQEIIKLYPFLGEAGWQEYPENWGNTPCPVGAYPATNACQDSQH